MKYRLSRDNIERAIHHPHLAMSLLLQRRASEDVRRTLVAKELELLQQRYSKAVQSDTEFLQVPGVIQEMLQQISPSKKEHSWRTLNQWHSFLYAATRSLRPRIVVETGVLYGASSAAILQALEENGLGLLLSIDLPPNEHKSIVVGKQYIQVGLASKEYSIGSAVPFSIRRRWDLRLGNSLEILPIVLEEYSPISMFVHDSLHVYDHMIAEFSLAYQALQPGGILVSDDITYNDAWPEFCKLKNQKWVTLSKGTDTKNRFAFLVKFTNS